MVFIIAEVGVNHNGSVKTALELIDVAVAAGADAVKFQTFNSSSLVQKGAPMATYQKENTEHTSQDRMLEKLELTRDDFLEISTYCQEKNIIFISTPFDLDSVDILADLGVSRYKVGSGDLTNYQLLRRIGSKNKPVILSTGMSNYVEVEAAIKILEDAGASEIVLLHCVSCYPTRLEDVNMKAIVSMRDNSGLDVGFSDHTDGYHAAVVAVSLGATHLEKHFTLDTSMEGPDHKASATPEELKEYIDRVRQTEIMLGDGRKRCVKAEEEVRAVVRRSIALCRDMVRGQTINESDIICLRPYSGISAIYLDDIVGRTLLGDKKSHTILDWSDLTSE